MNAEAQTADAPTKTRGSKSRNSKANVDAGLSQADAQSQVRALSKALNRKYRERKGLIDGLMQAAVAGESILMLGPPGTGKSALTIDVAESLGLSSFQRLLGKQTEPSELFGPYSLEGLRNDRYERVTTGFMPEAEVVFLDEVFKGSSAILNAILTIINERVFDNGPVRQATPLRMVVGASNELAQEEGLDALYDRFLLRFSVNPIKSNRDFSVMMLGSAVSLPSVTREALDVLMEAASGVDIKPVLKPLIKLRQVLSRDHGITPSDRRWKRALNIVRSKAALDGRNTATQEDLSVLANILWDLPEQETTIAAETMKMRSPEVTKLTQIMQAADEKIRDLGNINPLPRDRAANAGSVHMTLQAMCREASELMNKIPEPDREVGQRIVDDLVSKSNELSQAINSALGGASI